MGNGGAWKAYLLVTVSVSFPFPGPQDHGTQTLQSPLPLYPPTCIFFSWYTLELSFSIRIRSISRFYRSLRVWDKVPNSVLVSRKRSQHKSWPLSQHLITDSCWRGVGMKRCLQILSHLHAVVCAIIPASSPLLFSWLTSTF